MIYEYKVSPCAIKIKLVKFRVLYFWHRFHSINYANFILAIHSHGQPLLAPHHFVLLQFFFLQMCCIDFY